MTNKLFSSVIGLLAEIFVILNFVFVVNAQTQERGAQRNCTGAGCAAMSKAELFIKTFASSGSSKGLRTSQLEQEEQVRLAFYGIDATRVEVEAGRLTEQEGTFIIDGHEQVIRNYIQDKAGEAKVSAATGQVSDIPAINKSMGKLLSVARQDALMGREELAQRAQAEMVTVLTTFSQEFANTCQQQTFPVETAIVLERQNELMGTGISLKHCMNRKFWAELSNQGVQYRFETCSDLMHFPKKWELKISGRVAGEGTGENGWWEASFLWKGIKTTMGGEMEIFNTEIEVQEEFVKIPNDAGPNARPNGWASAPVPNPPARPNKVQVWKMRIAPLHLIGNRAIAGNYTEGPVEAEVRREDKPCTDVTDDS